MVKKRLFFRISCSNQQECSRVCVESGKICEFLRIETEEGDVFVIKKGEDDANR